MDMHRELDAEKQRFLSRTAWKLEATLREFAKPRATYAWFSYPLHVIDNTEVLSDIDKAISKGSNYAVNFGHKKTTEERRTDRLNALDNAFSFLTANGEKTVSVTDVSEHLGITEKTVRNHVTQSGKYYIMEGEIGLKG